MDCDVSLYDTAIGLLTYPATWHLNAGFEPVRTRHSAHPSLVPFQAFEAKPTAGWSSAAPRRSSGSGWPVVIERPEWATDPRFATFADRDRQPRRAARRCSRRSSRTRTVAEWLEPLQRGRRSRAAPINDVAAALTEPHTAARDLVVETEHPRYGTVRQVASPVRVGAAAGRRTAARRCATRTPTTSSRDLLGYDADRRSPR